MSRNTAKKLERKCGHCYRRACREADEGVEQCDICKLRDWLRNYHLDHSDAFNLFNEFLEMGKPRNKKITTRAGPPTFYSTCTNNYTNPIIPNWLNDLLQQAYVKFKMDFNGGTFIIRYYFGLNGLLLLFCFEINYYPVDEGYC